MTSRYLQVQSFASKQFVDCPNPPPKDLSYSVFNVKPLNKGTVSRIIKNRDLYTWDKTKTVCETDIGESILEEMWDSIIWHIHNK